MVKTVILLFTILNGYFALGYPFDYASILWEDPNRISMDFIIVGGGSAGSTLAACLSEIPEWNILLIEAGGNPPQYYTENPFMWTQNFKQNWDWNFKCEKCGNMYKGMDGEQYSIAGGYMLGGSSSLNAMIYLRGTYEDFEHWEKHHGCDGWNYDNVLYYFKNPEDFVDNLRFNPKIHSRGGPLTVSPLETYDPAYSVIAKAEQSLNMNMINDFNIKKPYFGYGNIDTTTRKGRRCSTLTAFLNPASNRSNLYVAKNTLVSRVVLNGKTAVGVEFLTPSNEYKIVNCKKEVLISAGPVKSSQLLMLSGIGPQEHLNTLDIPIIKNLSVGYNLMDHISFPALVFTDRKTRSKEEISKESKALFKEETSFFSRNIGSLGISKLMTFYKTDKNKVNPDIQIIKFRVPCNSSNLTPNKENIMSNMFKYSQVMGKYFENLNMLSDLIVMVPILLQPLTTGRVMLNSRNPRDPPKIFACYLRHQEEIETLLKGIEFVVQLSKTDEMKNYGFVLEDLKLEDVCQDHKCGTREHWICGMRYMAAPFFHAVGTNKMGSINDSNSVVDCRLKVIGINRLRVIDSSIMPSIVSVNTNAATIMIATKGCDMIKQSHGYKPKPVV